jgi:predicted Rossmann-fold nucleotide-binding protein
MKPEIDHPDKLAAWLAAPVPAVFQGQDLRLFSATMAGFPLRGCAFLGCRMERNLAEAAADAGCVLLPAVDGLVFDPFHPGLYSPSQLFEAFDPGDPATYQRCLDFRIYESFMHTASHEPREVDVEVTLLRRLHDASISEALDDFLDPVTRLRCVAIMGGHDARRDSEVYAQVAQLALDLTRAGYLVLTGGGPGLMEAGNLGAYAAGFAAPELVLAQAIATMKSAPLYKDKLWLAQGYAAWKAMGAPADPLRSQSVGIPTWFYGHEPPNVFATHVAKYFENSVREEGLLAFALGGVVFAPGNAGTVQEIFQDACQNYYRTYAKRKSPMILFGSEYWQVGKPAWALLQALGKEKGFGDYLLLTDEVGSIVPFLQQHPPAE